MEVFSDCCINPPFSIMHTHTDPFCTIMEVFSDCCINPPFYITHTHTDPLCTIMEVFSDCCINPPFSIIHTHTQIHSVQYIMEVFSDCCINPPFYIIHKHTDPFCTIYNGGIFRLLHQYSIMKSKKERRLFLLMGVFSRKMKGGIGFQ